MYTNGPPLCRYLFLFTAVMMVILLIGVKTSSAQYVIKTIVGNGVKDQLKVNVPALEASIGSPYCVVQSKNGDVYLSSHVHHVILKAEFDKTEGTWSTVTIIAGTGSAGKGNDGALGTESALSFPTGISLVESGKSGELTAIIITDYNNHRIRKLDMKTQLITTIAGNGFAGFSGDDDQATSAQLKFPYHAYYDKSSGDILIVDSGNNRIRRVRDGIITTVVGECQTEGGNGDGGPAIDACLDFPTHVVMNDAGEWFIPERNTGCIRKVGLAGQIDTVAGGGTELGDAPAKDVQLFYPLVLDVTSTGELLVADTGNGLIRKMDSSGFMKVIAGGGSTTPTNDDIPANTASFLPWSVAYARDGSDDIVIAHDGGRILKLTKMFYCFGVMGNSPSVCSGHGSCIGIDQCKCDDGWMGIDCSITHCFGVTSNLPDRVCSGKGKCVRHNKCHCEDGYLGHKCQRPPRS